MASEDLSKQFSYVGGKRYWVIVSRYSLGFLFMDLLIDTMDCFLRISGISPQSRVLVLVCSRAGASSRLHYFSSREGILPGPGAEPI